MRALAAVALVGVLSMVAAACSSSNPHGHATVTAGPSTSVSHPATHQVVVSGRASSPTETTAPGIQFTQGDISVTVAGHAVSVPADDWNTITASSKVPHDVGLSLDPDFHAADTTRNRFQYLADQMAQYAPSQFDPVGVLAAPVGQTLITIIAMLNLTPNTYRLNDLQVTVSAGPPTTTLGEATVYDGSSNALVIPGDDVYFVRLSLPVTASRPSTATAISYSFHYGSLYDCGTTPC